MQRGKRGAERSSSRGDGNEICRGAIKGELPLRARLGGEEKEKGYARRCDEVCRDACDGADIPFIEQSERGGGGAESRGYGSRGKLSFP